MPSLDQDIINLIDQRIRLAQATIRAAGTCVARDSTGPGAQVTFDGSTVAMPVKVAGGVFLQPGNRCLLDKYGSDWVVTESWAAVGLGEASFSQFATATSGTISATTFTDLNEVGNVQFNKVYDATYVEMSLTASASTSVSGAGVRWALHWSPLDTGSSYTATDYSMNWIRWDATGQHWSSAMTLRATNIPSGSYRVNVRWRRANGTTGATVTTDDFYAVALNEGIRASVPIL